MTRQWLSRPLDTPNAVHVLPIDDLREHVEREDCWCQPRIERYGTCAMVSHNSADGRELVERHGLQ